MQTRLIELTNRLGLHARACAKIVRVASQFRCNISLVWNGRCASARSIMAVTLLAVQKELETLHGAMTSGDAPAEFGAFLDVHWMILTDPTLHEVPKRTIAEQLCNAEWALTQQLGVLIEQFDMIEDPYLRERKADVVHVVERVLKVLLGKPGGVRTASAERQTIIVAYDLSPADVMQLN